jgi:hypothetical protein
VIRPAQNPFRAERAAGIPFLFDQVDRADLLRRLTAEGARGLIVGPQGSGKTTLLREVERELARKGLPVLKIALNSSRPHRWLIPSEIRRGNVESHFVLLDGLEQLGDVSWKRAERMCRKSRGLVATSHVEGRLPVLFSCQTSERLLDRVLESLVDPVPEPLRHLARELWHRHQGNLRMVLWDLYDHVSRWSVAPSSERLQLRADLMARAFGTGSRLLTAGSKESEVDGLEDGASSVADAELSENARDLILHRPLTGAR